MVQTKNIIELKNNKDNLDKKLLLNIPIILINARLPQVKINRWWNPIKKSDKAKAIITNGLDRKPKYIDAYNVKASTGVKFGGWGKYLKTKINTNMDKKSKKFVPRLLYLRLLTAKSILKSALERKESLGAHYIKEN